MKNTHIHYINIRSTVNVNLLQYTIWCCVRNVYPIYACSAHAYIRVEVDTLYRYGHFHVPSIRSNRYRAHAKSTKLNVTKMTMKYIYEWYKYKYNPFNNTRAFGRVSFSLFIFFILIRTLDDVHKFLLYVQSLTQMAGDHAVDWREAKLKNEE